MKNILLLAFIILQTSFAYSQCKGWNWPQDKKTAMSKVAAYTDAVKAKDFTAAQLPHLWLLKNAPDLNTSIYINGVKLYVGLLDQEEDKTRQAVLVDSLMLLYDMRIRYCNEQADVTARKAYDAYRFKVRDESAWPDILKMFDEAYELNKEGLPDYMMMPYMDIARRNMQQKNITEDEMVERHDNILDGLDRRIASETDATKKAKLEEIKGNVQGMVSNDDPISCDYVKNELEPKFRENPTDTNMAKRIFGLMLKAKCTDDPLWVETGELIAEQEPGFGIYKNLAAKAQAGGNEVKAKELYNKAAQYAKTNEDKAELMSYQASQLAAAGRYSEARKMYYQALKTNPADKSPYSGVGYLYYNSFNTCAGKKNIVKDRAVFLAAYDKFMQGGNSSMAAQAKAQFPSKTEIFEQNMKVGKRIKTGCWIGESSTLRSRD